MIYIFQKLDSLGEEGVLSSFVCEAVAPLETIYRGRMREEVELELGRTVPDELALRLDEAAKKVGLFEDEE
jgi:hypothetical protein